MRGCAVRRRLCYLCHSAHSVDWGAIPSMPLSEDRRAAPPTSTVARVVALSVIRYAREASCRPRSSAVCTLTVHRGYGMDVCLSVPDAKLSACIATNLQ